MPPAQAGWGAQLCVSLTGSYNCYSLEDPAVWGNVTSESGGNVPPRSLRPGTEGDLLQEAPSTQRRLGVDLRSRCEG